MYLLGYSLDNLSLMGLTIAVGFVVDDAIVVIENIHRHVERGVPPQQAALDGAREVGFTVVSMTTSLIAVFIPVLFMSGVIGRLFREFAMTVGAAIVMSGLISLTVTPTMCARLIRHHRPEEHGRLYRVCERVFDAMLRFYDRGLRAVLRHPAITLAATVATLAATIYGYTIMPKGFFPEQDTGLILGVAEAAPDTSFAAMADRIQALGPHCHGRPGCRQRLLLDRPQPDRQPGPDDDQPEAAERPCGFGQRNHRPPEAATRRRSRESLCSCRSGRTSRSAAGRARRSISIRCRMATAMNSPAGRRYSKRN